MNIQNKFKVGGTNLYIILSPYQKYGTTYRIFRKEIQYFSTAINETGLFFVKIVLCSGDMFICEIEKIEDVLLAECVLIGEIENS